METKHTQRRESSNVVKPRAGSRRREYETELTYEQLLDQLDLWEDRLEGISTGWEESEYWREGSELYGNLARFAPEKEKDFYHGLLIHSLLQLGRYHKARGGDAWEKAVSLFRHILEDENQPDHSLANYRIGIIYFARKEYLLAAQAFARSLRRQALMAEHRINEEQAVKARLWQAKAYQCLARDAAKGLARRANMLRETEDKRVLVEQAEELEAQLMQRYIFIENGVRRSIGEDELDVLVYGQEPCIAVLDYLDRDDSYLILDVGRVRLTTGMADLLRCLFESELPQDQQAIYRQLHRKPMPQKNTAVKKSMSALREQLRTELHKKMPLEDIEKLILTKAKDGYEWNRKLYPYCRVVHRETDTHCLDFISD